MKFNMIWRDKNKIYSAKLTKKSRFWRNILSVYFFDHFYFAIPRGPAHKKTVPKKFETVQTIKKNSYSCTAPSTNTVALLLITSTKPLWIE